jgi:uncharacterized LabA/DUF88 family protein
MLGETYLFIDGGYLQAVYRERFNPLFGDKYLIDYSTVMTTFGARRAYLYDCLDDVQKPGESATDFAARVERQEARFDEIGKAGGVIVRYGHLSPGKKRQQKEVDVLLAVDMLTHSFNKSMDAAVLLTGDRDFRPVVESVVRLGTLVKVAFDPRTGSKHLAHAADSEFEIDLTTLCDWIRLEMYENRAKHFPRACMYSNCDGDPLAGYPAYRGGVIGPEKRALGLAEANGVWQAAVKVNRRDFYIYSFHDRPKLLEFLAEQCGEITW